MHEVVQVKIREAGKVAYYDIAQLKLSIGDYVIVEADRGLEYGQVISEVEKVMDKDVEDVVRNVLRLSTAHDMRQIKENEKRAQDALKTAVKKIAEHKLPMKLIDVEYSFDRSKIIFYFTAEGRVDFRDLVKDLAAVFKARIELKQIGVRDEAKFLGGLGPCGRPLCCAGFLKNFEPVTIRMAKDQKLPLASSKISGLCGRLMCCLSFEYKMYKEALKDLPREGQTIKTPSGKGKVVDVDVLNRLVSVELEDSRIIQVKYNDQKEQSKEE
ncbi:MAG: stage 0 sporulation family protein [Candidatus Kappaea frigidicola]|nr:stage 0 sporulation family protein [Candidatus Kappaea frigidicola]